MLLPIVKLPAEVLRRPTEAVSFPLDKKTKRLVADMLDTVKYADGIGLAAPQVGQGLNLAIIYLVTQDVPAFPIFNAKVTKSSKEMLEIEEGCLSMPGVFGVVTRPKKITISFQDMTGKRHELTDDGWIGRVCQHEIDHLFGTLIIDKLGKVTQGAGLLNKYK
jgi:peptide deformylase